MLSDRDIKRYIADGAITLEPFDAELIQPASVDIKLDNNFRTFTNSRHPVIPADNPPADLTQLVHVCDNEQFILHPGEFVLASTIEYLTLGDNIAARLEGKSSMGRIGLMIHSTAGFIDPGFEGQITLELSNVARLPLALTPRMKIGQLSFIELSSPCEFPYGSPKLGSKYQHQQGPTPSRTEPMHTDEENAFNQALATINQATRTHQCDFDSVLDDQANIFFRYSVQDDAADPRSIMDAIHKVVNAVFAGKAVRIKLPDGAVMLMPRWNINQPQ